jgi:hypothetical protein
MSEWKIIIPDSDQHYSGREYYKGKPYEYEEADDE